MGKKFIWLLLLCLMAAYPIYKNFYYGRAITTYERHRALVEKRSEYFNPWQYRVLSPWLIEAAMVVYSHTIDKIYPVEEKLNLGFRETSEPTQETKELLTVLQQKGAVKYFIVFLLVRFAINLGLLYAAFRYFSLFTANRPLVLSCLFLITLAMGNGVLASDLTFNTYLDNLFYILAALIIVRQKNPLWLLPLTLIAALNRETSLFIPILYFVSQMQVPLTSWKIWEGLRWPQKKTWFITAACLALFAIVFVSVRSYYGYQAPQIWKVPSGLPMLKLNLFSAVAVKNVFEIYGVLGILPVIAIAWFAKANNLYQKWFLVLVPAWLLVHLVAVVAYQSRLFLVPLLLILIPMLLQIVDRLYRETLSKQPDIRKIDDQVERQNP